MANALQTRPQGSAVAATSAYDPFTRAGEMDSSGQGQYLKFNGKTGEYTYGQNAEELPEGTLLATDMNQAKWGWICWVDGEVKDERMKRVVDGDPEAEETLPDYGPYTKHPDGSEDGWSKQRLLVFKDPVSGEEYIYKTSSGSGVRAFGSLMKDYGRNYKQYPGMIPLVALGVGSFIPKNNPKVGKVYTPEFKITDWRSEEELLAQVGGAGDDGAEYEGEGQAAEGEAQTEEYAESGEYVDGEGQAEVAGDYQDDGVIEGDYTEVQEPEPEPEPAPPARPAPRQPAPAPQQRQAAPAAQQTRPAAPAAQQRPAAPAQRPAAPAAQPRPAAAAPAAGQRQPPQMQPRPAPAAPAPAPQGAGGPARQRRF